MTTATQDLKERWTALKAENPNLRIRNGADQLNTSEVQLLALECGSTVTRLRDDFKGILSRIPKLGYVMALTRNNEIVHERKGVFSNQQFMGPMGLFAGEDIDLRIFFHAWKSCFAVTVEAHGRTLQSLQFFDRQGNSIHKIFLTEKSNREEYNNILEDYRDENQAQEESVEPSAETDYADAREVDAESFRKEWLNLKDTHDFFPMLKKYKLNRLDALRLAPEGHAALTGNDCLKKVLRDAAEKELPIMVFVGNKGMIQIHTGPVKNLLQKDNWFNVMDPEFNLHINESGLNQSWVVKKPSSDGIITSLEVFNPEGELIVSLFGKRKPGIAEDEGWRELLTGAAQN